VGGRHQFYLEPPPQSSFSLSDVQSLPGDPSEATRSDRMSIKSFGHTRHHSRPPSNQQAKLRFIPLHAGRQAPPLPTLIVDHTTIEAVKKDATALMFQTIFNTTPFPSEAYNTQMATKALHDVITRRGADGIYSVRYLGFAAH
jgi:hypothetical protein